MDNKVRDDNPFRGVAPFNLTIAMSELLALGMQLEEIIATVTANAAAMVRMQDEIGTLKPGREADVSVVDILNGRFKLSDNNGVEVITDRLIRPVFCLRGGMRHDSDSPFIPRAIAA